MARRLAFALVLAAVAYAGDPAGPPSTRLVWSGPSTNLLGSLSPDGSLLSYVEPGTGDLSVYSIETGAKRALTTNPPDAKTFAYFSAFSRDGSQLAYAWFNEEGYYELWTVPVDGGEPRKLYSNPENGFVQPCDWSLDGSQILTLFFRKDNVSQIALVSSEDGSVQTLKTLSWFYPKKISFSPDGRYILYDSLTGRDSVARDILLLDADGGAERPLIADPANDIFPQWTPSGDGILFASDRAGEMDLYLAPFADGAITGEPRPLARRFGRALPLGVSRGGAYYFGLRAGRADIVVAAFDGARTIKPSVAGVRAVGRNTAPAWSSDGRRLAYLTQLGTENYGQESRGIVVWVPETRQETMLRPRLASIAALRWSPGDTRLLASGSDGRGRAGLFSVDPDTGEARGIVRLPGGPPEGLEGDWVDSSSLAFLTLERNQIRTAVLGQREQEFVYSAPKGARLAGIAVHRATKKVAVGVRQGGEFEVWTVGLSDGVATPFANLPSGPVEALEWRGRELYATVAGDRVFRITGRGAKPELVKLPGAGGGPRFSPDGERVAYVQNDRREEVWALEGWWRPKADRPEPPTRGASGTPPSAP